MSTDETREALAAASARLAAVERVIDALDDEHYDTERGGGKYCREGSCATCNAITRLNAAMRTTASGDARPQTMTLAEVDALTGDDIAYWLSNPFMTPDLLAEKVCWWVTTAIGAAPSSGGAA